jgi:hypothetical protein
VSSIITIPAPVVRLLRHALLSELGAAAQLITSASFEPERERHPEWFVPPLQHSDACRELLAEIGCGEPDEPHDAMIDLDGHRAVLTAALRQRLTVEHDFHASSPGKSARKEASQNIREIETFLTTKRLDPAAPHPVTAERWLHHQRHALAGNTRRLAALLLDVYDERRRRKAPADPTDRQRLALQLLLEDNDETVRSVGQLARRIGGRKQARETIAALREAGLVHTIGDCASPTLAARTFHQLNPSEG